MTTASFSSDLPNVRGYGPSNHWQSLYFDGDERKFETWRVKILAFLRLRNLKDTILGIEPIVDPVKNEEAFS